MPSSDHKPGSFGYAVFGKVSAEWT